jgi:hypothetical protein
MQYFTSFEPFEIFDEFNGVRGIYIKSFLNLDKMNLADGPASDSCLSSRRESQRHKSSKNLTRSNPSQEPEG